MQADAVSKKALKHWRILPPWAAGHTHTLQLEVTFPNHDKLYYYANLSGASPAYIEQTIEELNLAVNELEYNLARIPVQVCAS